MTASPSPDMSAAESTSFRGLVEAGIAFSAELSLDALLRRVVETAVRLTGAQYGALGVIDASGASLEQFITVGVDDDTKAAIGDLPRGRGVLGALISERRALRLADLGQDGRSIGFPPGHPPMRSFLGVPIEVRGTGYGNLYLTEKDGGAEFDESDEEIVRLLASQAAVAIENARLYESARHWSRQLDSLNEISNALTDETDLRSLLELAAGRLRELLDATGVMIARPSPNRTELVVEAVDAENAARLVGLRLSAAHSKMGQALSRMRSERIDSVIDDPEVDQSASRLVGSTTTLVVPLIVAGKGLGVMAAWDKHGPNARFTDADLRLAEAFATRASLALEFSERVVRQTVQTLIEGQERERARLAGELREQTGQALSSILVGLEPLEEQLGNEPIAHIRELVGSALADVSRLATELRPQALDDLGLKAALERLFATVMEKSSLDVRLRVGTLSPALPGTHETALYRIIQEALTNIVKHAAARKVEVAITSSAGSVHASIEDDGVGFDLRTVRDGALGLVGMQERASLLGGRVEIASTPGRGTMLSIELPVTAWEAEGSS